ncbi:helix-turn-helix domain-containing protein [Actinoplanes sp. NPDC051494]|uniref:helix-turn-helix domain-containing protein n=1 Tax=Actinoplanes sp. NPDC051494 TaxID=3363907 RepID=UPI0037BDB24C
MTEPGDRDDSDRSLQRRLQDPKFREAFEDTIVRNELLGFLINLRRRWGWTQSELAGRMRTTQSAISDFEKGRIQPRVSTLQRWARVFGYRLEMQVWTGPFVAYDSWTRRSVTYESVVDPVRIDDAIGRWWSGDQAQPGTIGTQRRTRTGNEVQTRYRDFGQADSRYLRELQSELAPRTP